MKNLYAANYQIECRLRLVHYLAACVILLLISLQAQAQVGVGTTTPDASAQLDVSSTNKGVLIPRMNRAERDLIQTPATGLLIFQTNEAPGFYFYDGTGWGPLVSSGSSTIIPFASGNLVNLSTSYDISGGNSVGLIGFGASGNHLQVISNLINLPAGGNQLANFAFPVPRSGTIESISGSFTTVSLVSPLEEINVVAQVYKALGDGSTFVAVPGAQVVVATYSGVAYAGTVGNGIVNGLNIPVNPQDRLMLVFSATSLQGTSFNIPGYASAGLSIK